MKAIQLQEIIAQNAIYWTKNKVIVSKNTLDNTIPLLDVWSRPLIEKKNIGLCWREKKGEIDLFYWITLVQDGVVVMDKGMEVIV